MATRVTLPASRFAPEQEARHGQPSVIADVRHKNSPYEPSDIKLAFPSRSIAAFGPSDTCDCILCIHVIEVTAVGGIYMDSVYRDCLGDFHPWSNTNRESEIATLPRKEVFYVWCGQYSTAIEEGLSLRDVADWNRDFRHRNFVARSPI